MYVCLFTCPYFPAVWHSLTCQNQKISTYNFIAKFIVSVNLIYRVNILGLNVMNLILSLILEFVKYFMRTKLSFAYIGIFAYIGFAYIGIFILLSPILSQPGPGFSFAYTGISLILGFAYIGIPLYYCSGPGNTDKNT